MDITEKMVSFQIIQNIINVKTTLAAAIAKYLWNRLSVMTENLKNWFYKINFIRS